MRAFVVALLIGLALIQYPLWWGKGGWQRVWEMQRQIGAQNDLNAGLRLRNAALEAELKDLQAGTDAIEERARQELGLVSGEEVFVQFMEGASLRNVMPAPPAPAPR
ncbi:cell division protein FtsB [Verticiella sediminum]|uniref:Cell division protein FtsB n=1 Tax=Verticiella sediminum TaxID=1247510 RepID=A0A556AW36_9BURK|nr:cell division protein FtsB [Verticiella sediminum]TSH97130.1 cell division protein FtsB [Verticiella sediminum]